MHCSPFAIFLPAAPPSPLRRSRLSHVPGIEPLEARIAPATIVVTSLGDDFVVDGKVTLAEAIKAANTDTSIDGSVVGQRCGYHHLRAGAHGGRAGDDPSRKPLRGDGG